MKTSTDPRHQNRIQLFKLMFEFSFDKKIPQKIKPIIKKLTSIDKLIAKHAPEWPINKLNKVDLALLRLSIFELKYNQKTPTKVVIDEAVEIGKKFGTEKTSKFVNGVLNSLIHETN